MKKNRFPGTGAIHIGRQQYKSLDEVIDKERYNGIVPMIMKRF